jgi:hypothetical protein
VSGLTFFALSAGRRDRDPVCHEIICVARSETVANVADQRMHLIVGANSSPAEPLLQIFRKHLPVVAAVSRFLITGAGKCDL